MKVESQTSVLPVCVRDEGALRCERQARDGSVEVIPYAQAPVALRREFALLQQRVYPDPEQKEEDCDTPIHDPVFDVISFYIAAEEGRIVSYAAVAMKKIRHAGDTFNIAGLSCVMTDPKYQRQGLGRQVIIAATHYMERSHLDFGIFTCDPELAAFYVKAGWPVVSNVVLIGNRDETALRSDTLNKVVLMRLFSDKAKAAASRLTHGNLDLDLPPGQFL